MKKRLKFDCFYSDMARIRITIILPDQSGSVIGPSGTFPKAQNEKNLKLEVEPFFTDFHIDDTHCYGGVYSDFLYCFFKIGFR